MVFFLVAFFLFQTVGLIGMLFEHFSSSIIYLMVYLYFPISLMDSHLFKSKKLNMEMFGMGIFSFFTLHAMLLAWFWWNLLKFKLQKFHQKKSAKMSEVRGPIADQLPAKMV